MDNPRAEKVAIVTEVRENLEKSDAAILTEYRGLTVQELARLRAELVPVGGTYKIYKNTLMRFAATDAGLEEAIPMLEGPTAVAFVDGDAAAAAKVIRDFGKDNPLLVVKGGVLGAKVLDAQQTTALAALPSREQLLGQLAGAFNAPMQQMASLLSAVPRDFANVLKALADKGGASEASTASAGEAPAGEASSEAKTESSEAGSAAAD